jgi:hypothetical protein
MEMNVARVVSDPAMIAEMEFPISTVARYEAEPWPSSCSLAKRDMYFLLVSVCHLLG